MSGERAVPGAPEPRPVPAVPAASFKLRFAAQREPGRSRVSLVRPAGLPPTVTDKWWSAARDEPPPALVLDAARRIQRAYGGRGTRAGDGGLTSHEYGRWVERAVPQEPRLRHHVRDSEWMKGRLRVLAADRQLAGR